MADEFYWCNGFNGICHDSNGCMNCIYANGAGGHPATPIEIMTWYGETNDPNKAYQFDIED